MAIVEQKHTLVIEQKHRPTSKVISVNTVYNIIQDGPVEWHKEVTHKM